MESSSVSFKLKHRWNCVSVGGAGAPIYEVSDLQCNVFLDGFTSKSKRYDRRRMVVRGQKIIFQEYEVGEPIGYEEILENGARFYPSVMCKIQKLLEDNKEVMERYIENRRELHTEKTRENEEWLLEDDIKMSF